MMRALLSTAALMVAAIPLTVAAKPISEAAINSGSAQIEPGSGYIFVSGAERQVGIFLRVPDVETIAEYEAEWAKEFAKAQKKYPSRLANWEARRAMAEQTKGKVPEMPIEPTAESFAIAPIEARDVVEFGSNNAYSKGSNPKQFTYLTKVKPGRYVYHGPYSAILAFGNCYCMGSVSFEVKAGVITNTGNFFMTGYDVDPAFPSAEKDVRGKVEDVRLYRSSTSDAAVAARVALNYDLPASLQGLPNEKAEFTASGKTDNLFRVNLSRMQPVAGVLAYNRDIPIDVKTGEPAHNIFELMPKKVEAVQAAVSDEAASLTSAAPEVVGGDAASTEAELAADQEEALQ